MAPGLRLGVGAGIVAGLALCGCSHATTHVGWGHAVDSGPFDVGPKVVHEGPVTVPEEVRRKPCTMAKLTEVEVVIDVQGRVRHTRIARPTDTPTFDQACVNGASQWIFVPAFKTGRPVESTARVLCHLECR
jgi:TonB family protein